MKAPLASRFFFLLFAVVLASVSVATLLILTPLIVPTLMTGLIDSRGRPFVAGESMGLETRI